VCGANERTIATKADDQVGAPNFVGPQRLCANERRGVPIGTNKSTAPLQKGRRATCRVNRVVSMKIDEQVDSQRST